MAKARSAIEMTARWLDRIKLPESGRVEYFDDNVHGLGLRVSATGHKSWFVMYRVKGDPKVKRLTLEPYPEMSLADAREKARQVIIEAGRGGDPAGRKQEDRKAPTFKVLAESYIDLYAKALNPKTGQPRKRSWKKDVDAIQRDLMPYWEHRKAKDIKKRDVIEVLDRVAARAPVQANRTLALIRKMYNWGISRDIVEVNPCAQITPPSAETQRDRVLSESEIRAFWRACDSLGPLVAAAFRLRLITGQRGGEVQTMRWSDLDLDSGWWTIPAERAKNKTEHRVPLSDLAIGILRGLEARSNGSPWVFPSRMKKDQPLTNPHASARTLREKVGELLGLDSKCDFDLHDLRRTAGTSMASLGINRLIVSRVLNHAEGGVTWIYDRYSYDAEKRQALTLWADRLKVILGESPEDDE